MDKFIEVLTPEKTSDYLRSLGMHISAETVRLGLQQKAFPFGDAVEGGKTPRFFVYKKLLDQWVAERSN